MKIDENYLPIRPGLGLKVKVIRGTQPGLQLCFWRRIDGKWQQGICRFFVPRELEGLVKA